MAIRKLGAMALIAGTLATASTPLLARAVSTFSIESIGGSLGLGSADLKTTIINIIQFALGFMVLIAVVFIIYAGIIWMTAAGNEDRVEKAKSIITAAVIGLVIVLLAWAIVIFVARTTANVTT